jgi:hypothetical protein
MTTSVFGCEHLSIVQADRLARALGTTLSQLFVEVEPEVIPS